MLSRKIFGLITILAITISLLTGCGFHLRGETTLPAEIFISNNGDDRELVFMLTSEVAKRGVTVSPTATTQIEIQTADFDRHLLTTDENGLAESYRLNYRVTFSITGADPHTTTLTRISNYESDNPLKSETKIEALQTKMRDEVITRIITILARQQ